MERSILWGFAALMSIGTGTEIGTGEGRTAIELLDLDRDKIVVVLFKEAELQSLL